MKHLRHASGDTGVVVLPPLDALVAPNGTIVGDISWMLDFAVIAFPKSGTTFMKDYLNQTTATHVHERELCMKRPSDVAHFVRIYHELHVRLGQPRHPKIIQFGLKCPGVLYRADDIHLYHRYFPRTKFIVGLRHPVSWFESFYNYQSYRNVSLPPTSELVGRCPKHRKVCTDRARFHAALARLGMTPMGAGAEMDLLLGTNWGRPRHGRYLGARGEGVANPVLLYEVRQIHDAGASKELSADLRRYLGIDEGFPPIATYRQNKTRAINICDEEHEGARRVLVEHGTDASLWIREYFLRHPRVTVASPDWFRRFMGDWGSDSCSNGPGSTADVA